MSEMTMAEVSKKSVGTYMLLMWWRLRWWWMIEMTCDSGGRGRQGISAVVQELQGKYAAGA
jgi:hypothetical protein